jgi:hypothetical protein
LKVNFKKHGNGAKKIDSGEFAIQDSATKRDIDLKADWDLCFFPGQRVDMSMIIRRDHALQTSSCPKCAHVSDGSMGSDIDWLVFSHIVHAYTFQAPSGV